MVGATGSVGRGGSEAVAGRSVRIEITKGGTLSDRFGGTVSMISGCDSRPKLAR